MGIVITGHKSSAILDCNQAFAEMLGYSIEEMCSKRSVDISHPEDRKLHVDDVEEMTKGKKKITKIEKRYLHKDGQIVWAEINIYFSLNEVGEIAYDILMVNNITAKKEAESNLKISERNFDILFDKAPFPLAIIKGGRLIDINGSLCQLLNYNSKEKLIGKTLIDISPEYQFCGSKTINKIVNQTRKITRGECTNYEWLHIDKNGISIPVRTYLNAVDIEGETYALALWHDLRKEKEDQNKINDLLDKLMLKNEELESVVEQRTIALEESNMDLTRSNKDLEQFASAASHDLQEPLRMVSNFLQILERQFSEKLGDEGRQYIHFAVDGANRMSKLVESLLQFSRLGKAGNELRKTDLNNIIHSKVLDLSKRIEEKNASILLYELPHEVLCEPNQTAQLFFNLINNGIKFNKNENPQITIKSEEHQDHWLFSVEDNGIGIDQKYKEQVFEVFQRLHRKEEFEGTGIGLSLCKRIVNLHKGEIWFDSEKDKGTTFYFTLHKN